MFEKKHHQIGFAPELNDFYDSTGRRAGSFFHAALRVSTRNDSSRSEESVKSRTDEPELELTNDDQKDSAISNGAGALTNQGMGGAVGDI